MQVMLSVIVVRRMFELCDDSIAGPKKKRERDELNDRMHIEEKLNEVSGTFDHSGKSQVPCIGNWGFRF